METKQLTRRQIFTMKNRKNLEKKVHKFWEETKNTDLVVEYIVAIILRNALIVSDFSLPCPEIVRELLFQAQPNDTLRKFCPFFKDYVEEHEWLSIIKRLFKNETKYYKATKKMRLYEGYLKDRGHAVITDQYDSYTLTSIFEDANGKKHTWNLRDADPSNTLEETKRILRVLTTLTIFHKGDVRQFVKFMDCDFKGTTTIYSTKQPKEQSAQKLTTETTKATVENSMLEGFDLSMLTKEELIALIKEIFEEAEEQMIEKGDPALNDEVSQSIEEGTNGQETSLMSRITPENDAQSLSNDAEESVPVLADYDEEKPPEKISKRRYTKKERELLKRFKLR
ncbi:hypothetical protein [Candidatus Enterococcus murrayae]|uniref:Uncharacterized protein n=1 Tax=Candidatus Enterococcus murrayae TaxID=2815321 RepID=A0ABS3HPS4_9ENTE|nr:hypothetical protein [Enterococcus sp. MJM16]MBO0454890.1 hypothetical protein [Enterococcus sp. MJM16]